MEEDCDLEKIIESKKSSSLNSEDLEKIIENIISNNPESVTDYKEGKDRAVKYLMGQIMKETKGSANPQLAMELLTQKLNEQ
jgi:aspartyl-tRNA(Asn)/glutamyl-tRNA(Gln) amidotransferase subunit B